MKFVIFAQETDGSEGNKTSSEYYHYIIFRVQCLPTNTVLSVLFMLIDSS